ncbi:hypothetical protein SY89_00151 [Halolamina pelagica]|uniref:Uncharacterized protein n=2 Tax=Halolamina pelagica TaxID=699431 RepID=A0A0P7FS48_9EURY|nr:hypothetical protein SY89_00151 [Halolamina pelagica]
MSSYSQYRKLETLGHMGHVREYSRKELLEFLNHTQLEISEAKYTSFNMNSHSNRVLDTLKQVVPKFIPKLHRFQVIIAENKL